MSESILMDIFNNPEKYEEKIVSVVRRLDDILSEELYGQSIKEVMIEDALEMLNSSSVGNKMTRVRQRNSWCKHYIILDLYSEAYLQDPESVCSNCDKVYEDRNIFWITGDEGKVLPYCYWCMMNGRCEKCKRWAKGLERKRRVFVKAKTDGYREAHKLLCKMCERNST